MTSPAVNKPLPSIKSFPVDNKSEHLAQKSSLKDCEKQVAPRSQRVVISKSRWPIGLIVHAVPVLAAGVIIAINLQGYFIGTQFVGVFDSTSQSIALLSLQVTAKLLEMTAIASLGYIILDILHHFLLFDEDGLPLALTGIRLSFSNLFSLASPGFWSGIRAFRSRRAQILVAFLLLSCSLIATFIGPAAALLLIPAVRKDWLAGSLFYSIPKGQWLVWHSQMSNSSMSHHQRSLCVGPSEDIVSYPSGLFGLCIWSAAAILGSVVVPMNIPPTGNVTVQDLAYSRDVSWSVYDENSTWPTLWAWSSMSIANVIAGDLYSIWAASLNATKPYASMEERNFGLTDDVGFDYNNNTWSSWSSLSQYSRYSYRDRFGTQTKLQGMLAPSARTACQWSRRDFQDPSPYHFPVIPLNGIVPQDTNATYMINTTVPVRNTSIVRTSWIPKPASAPEIHGADPDKEYATHLPSAFLILQLPLVNTTQLKPTTFGPVVTCSIDARWVNATQFTTLFDEEEFYIIDDATGTPVTYSNIDETTFDSQGRPSIEKLSQRIALDRSWLEVLTPTFNRTIPGTNITQVEHGYTSLSKAIDSLLLSQFKSEVPPDVEKRPINDWIQDIVWRLQHLLSLLIVDGLARYNLDEFYEAQTNEIGDFLSQWVGEEPVDPALLLTAGGKPPQLQQDLSTLKRSEFSWTVTISGYAYVVDSTAYVLAVTVLFSYILFAVGHICFTIHKRWSSKIWWSIPNIVALAYHSPPSALLKNVSGGTDLSSSDKLLMRLRALDDVEKGNKTIHLLVDSYQQESSADKIEEYHKLEKGERYY